MSFTPSADLVITDARIVLGDEVITGSVQVRDGRITAIDTSGTAIGESFGGDYLIPGLVELHTDHLESHYVPRPKVRWSPIAAVQAHDAQIASSGITTVFDALRVGHDERSDASVSETRILSDAILQSQEGRRLRAEHFIHLRCEVSAPDCLESFARVDGHPLVRLASLMDHAPGQRQFAKLDAYKVYYQGKLKMSTPELEEFMARRIAQSEEFSEPNRQAIATLCHERGIVLASHDDATVAHVDEAIRQGIDVAEFPTTLDAARASHDAGLAVLMGAPNIVRGSSHSGNISARDLAREGVLDILSSDYIPFSLLQSAFLLSASEGGISLPDAVRMVSTNAAQATGLTDRGEIAIGKRADLVRVEVADDIPVVRSVWREGQRVV